MSASDQMAKHFRGFFYGENYTGVNARQTLSGINWQEATKKISELNSIAALVFHIDYYLAAVLGVLQGGRLEAHDSQSFDLPDIQSEEDWQNLLAKFWRDADDLILTLQKITDAQLKEPFAGEKYGNLHRNLLGLLEHSYYHLGQIALIRKLLAIR